MAQSVRTAVVHAAAQTTTGTQDFTSPGLGTPKAAIVLFGYGSVDGTIEDHSAIGASITDGTRHRTIHGRAYNNVATSYARRRGTTTQLVQLFNPTNDNIMAEGSFSSWITDGLRINWTMPPTSGIILTILLFAGDDVTAHVNDVTVNAGATMNVTTPGFKPDHVFTLGVGTTFGNTTSNDQPYNIGSAVRGEGDTVTQHSTGLAVQNGTAGNHVRNYINDLYFTTNLNPASESPSRSVRILGWLTGGFQVQNVVGDGNFALAFAYLALRYGEGTRVWQANIPSRITAGTQTITGPGFTPQLIGAFTTGNAEMNQTLSAGGSTSAVGFATPEAAGSTAVGGQHLASPSNTWNMTDNVLMRIPQADRSSGRRISVDSFNADGFTLNYQWTMPEVRQMIVFAIEGEEPTEPPSDVLTWVAPPADSTVDKTVDLITESTDSRVFKVVYSIGATVIGEVLTPDP